MKKTFRKFVGIFFILVIIGFLIPQFFQMPVKGAGKESYSQDSYWFYPWGKSITHKGVDIFAKKGTPIYSSTLGIVVFTGEIDMGGKVVLILGPKWRFHYYAHMNEVRTRMFSLVGHETEIGTVGDTGNAKGKPPHLHYAIRTFIPYPWRMDNKVQGWKKMFFLNPIDYLNEAVKN